MLLYYIMGQIQYLLGAIVLIVLDGIYLNIIKRIAILSHLVRGLDNFGNPV